MLTSLPLYYFSIFKAPVSIIKILEKKIRDFLWNDSEDSKRKHLINWDLVNTPTENGGLGLKSLQQFNNSMLAKWSWRYAIEREALWWKVITERHGVSASLLMDT